MIQPRELGGVTKALSLTTEITADRFPDLRQMRHDDYEHIRPVFEPHFYTLLAIIKYFESRITRAVGVDESRGDKNMTEWSRWTRIYDTYLIGLGLTRWNASEIQRMDSWRQLFGLYKRSKNLQKFVEAPALVDRLGLAISVGFDQRPETVKLDHILESLRKSIGLLEQRIRQKPERPSPEETQRAFDAMLEQWRKEYTKLVHDVDI